MFGRRGSSCYPAGMTQSPHPIVVDAAPMAAVPRFAAESRRNRALFANFFKRELTTRYLGSATGLAWALLHPLALLAVYYFVFTIDIPRRGLRRQRASCCSSRSRCGRGSPRRKALQRATVSLANYAGLIRKVAFPHELVVYASVAATLTLQFAGYLAVLVVARRLRRAGPLRGTADRRAAMARCWRSR